MHESPREHITEVLERDAEARLEYLQWLEEISEPTLEGDANQDAETAGVLDGFQHYTTLYRATPW